MRIIIALTVRRFEIVPTKDVYRVLKLTVCFFEVELI